MGKYTFNVNRTFWRATSHPCTGRCTISTWRHWQRGRVFLWNRWSPRWRPHLEPELCSRKWSQGSSNHRASNTDTIPCTLKKYLSGGHFWPPLDYKIVVLTKSMWNISDLSDKCKHYRACWGTDTSASLNHFLYIIKILFVIGSGGCRADLQNVIAYKL